MRALFFVFFTNAEPYNVDPIIYLESPVYMGSFTLMRTALFQSLFATMLVVSADASESHSTQFEIVQVAAGIYVHPGRQVGIDHENRGDSANIGFIVGRKCVAVVDSGGSIDTGRALLAAIRIRTNVPICYVINTHVHFDHILGNAAFVEDGVEFVGHQNLAEAIVSNREFFSEQFAQELDDSGPELVIGPTKSVFVSTTLDLGERNIVLKPHRTAHTTTDLSVFDENTDTLWTGDLVFIGRLPILEGSLRGWLTWLEEYQSKSFARIIPGHGPTAAGWPSAADAEREYLTALLTDARKAVADGIYIEDAIEIIGVNAASKWAVSDVHPRNASRAFRELEWE